MPHIDVPLVRGKFGETSRSDSWWVQPLLVFLGLSAFIVYSTWAALQGDNYSSGPYISPMYSPLLYGDPKFAWLGAGRPDWFPGFLPFSSAFLILWAPGGFRFTCYYYRGAYYKAFWQDPTNCTVGEPRKSYLGERSFPLIVQNIHRYFLYLAIIFIGLLTYDVWEATKFEDGFGIGLGTLILAVNVCLLGSYTFGCHSLRHLVGGMMDKMSKSPARKTAYDCVSCLNTRHQKFAWLSLFSVGFSDIYIRLCAMGIWHDIRFF